MDSVNYYRGWWQPKHLSRQEIEEMRKNMKKVPVIELQAEIYHNQETKNVESILTNLPKTETTNVSTPHTDLITRPNWYHRLRNRLQHIFTSSS